jgi:Ser/Thr protein kinase RdoA (MazF antagonist)
LLRLETSGPAVWFKAVGEPNIQEFLTCQVLARLFPCFVPRIIGAREDSHAWLTAEVEGCHPDEDSSTTIWGRTASTLASLEMASMGHGLHLLDAGLKDARTGTLRSLLPQFLEVVASLMEAQSAERPKRMCRDELEELREQIEQALTEFDDLALPNVVVHLDFNPGNIVVSERHCTFLDWAEGAVGPPFITLQYLLQHIRHLKPPVDDKVSAATSRYRNGWCSFVAPSQAVKAFLLAPLVAVVAYAVAGCEWSSPDRCSELAVAAHLRSLTRRMKYEAQALRERKLQCR